MIYIKSSIIQYRNKHSKQQSAKTMIETLPTTIKKSSFQSLRLAKQQFSKQIKLRSKKMKKQKYLKEEIYKNHNIFQSLTNVNHFSKTMTAQNIIWIKNYELKEGINKVKEENSSLKARIWNVEKENRKMDRQIQAWGLKKAFVNTSSKPYIDTATAQKVLHDQDYSITSIKILIVQLQHDLQMLSHTLEQSLSVNKNIKNIKNDMKHQVNSKKIQMYKLSFWDDRAGTFNVNQVDVPKDEKKNMLIRKNQELNFINKNIELKKKSRSLLEEELQKINTEIFNLADITREKITHLKQQAHKIRTQDESYVNEQLKKLTEVKQKYLQFQCKTQDRMGDFIKEKIELNKQISKYRKKIAKIEEVQKPKQAMMIQRPKAMQVEIR